MRPLKKLVERHRTHKEKRAARKKRRAIRRLGKHIDLERFRQRYREEIPSLITNMAQRGMKNDEILREVGLKEVEIWKDTMLERAMDNAKVKGGKREEVRDAMRPVTHRIFQKLRLGYGGRVEENYVRETHQRLHEAMDGKIGKFRRVLRKGGRTYKYPEYQKFAHQTFIGALSKARKKGLDPKRANELKAERVTVWGRT
jgi:hypothetical protein